MRTIYLSQKSHAINSDKKSRTICTHHSDELTNSAYNYYRNYISHTPRTRTAAL